MVSVAQNGQKAEIEQKNNQNCKQATDPNQKNAQNLRCWIKYSKNTVKRNNNESKLNETRLQYGVFQAEQRKIQWNLVFPRSVMIRAWYFTQSTVRLFAPKKTESNTSFKVKISEIAGFARGLRLKPQFFHFSGFKWAKKPLLRIVSRETNNMKMRNYLHKGRLVGRLVVS